MESNPGQQPADALASVAAARAAAADRLVTPWWYHPVLGALIGGYFVSASLGGTTGRLIGALVLCLGVGILIGSYRRLTGVWISGFPAGPAGRWVYGMIAALVVTLIAGSTLASTTSTTWPYWATAAAMTAVAAVFGRRFDAALRRQLREQP